MQLCFAEMNSRHTDNSRVRPEIKAIFPGLSNFNFILSHFLFLRQNIFMRRLFSQCLPPLQNIKQALFCLVFIAHKLLFN